MKKLLLPLLTLIIGFAAGYYFFNGKAKTTITSGGPIASDHSISREEAQMLVDTFGTQWMDDANNHMGGKGQKTRSVYISLTELDSLTAALDNERKKNGTTDGIRIYFGRYPKYHPDGKTPYDHAHHNTIILVSTKTTRILPKGAKDSITIHLDYYGSTNQKTVMHLFALDPLNRNDLCPDNCEGATLVCPDPTDPTCNSNN